MTEKQKILKWCRENDYPDPVYFRPLEEGPEGTTQDRLPGTNTAWDLFRREDDHLGGVEAA